MAMSELDDLLNDLEKTVEEERGHGKVIFVFLYFSDQKLNSHIKNILVIIDANFFSVQERALITMIWALVSQTHTLKITHHTCHQMWWR